VETVAETLKGAGFATGAFVGAFVLDRRFGLEQGFLLFRTLDAIKPYPIWKLERLGGAWGVMADDLAAGLIAAVLLATILHFGFGM